MKLTDYYKMAKLPTCKSKFRFDCVASTGRYEPFEKRGQKSREKRFKCYYSGTPDTFSLNAQRKAERVISDVTNISSVYTPDINRPRMGYGDTVGTNDALLFLFSRDFRQIEIFVARGFKNNQKRLFNLFVHGELEEEMDLLRRQARPTNAPANY